ncbi:low affinity immunoglobulin gamma Fc region receptor III-B-like [Pseudophryne corroboree]|uniref:low affinity immunoglobulin gamma Fc region receptor III-B-like n=1 Tax=Pseudophryne corroboree TaxID=495146 RepID=UPI003081A1A0
MYFHTSHHDPLQQGHNALLLDSLLTLRLPAPVLNRLLDKSLAAQVPAVIKEAGSPGAEHSVPPGEGHVGSCYSDTLCVIEDTARSHVIFTLTLYVGAAVRPAVTVTPNWSNIFLYESVTLTCNTGSTVHENQTYYWYRDNRKISIHQQRFTIQSAGDDDRGDYQCRTRTSQKSDPVGLRVFNNMLILQRPPMVYDGDPLTLRCHSFHGYNATNTTFYRNNTVLQFSVNHTELHFTKVDLHETGPGTYRCTKLIYHHGKYQAYSAETWVSVQAQRRFINRLRNTEGLVELKGDDDVWKVQGFLLQL